MINTNAKHTSPIDHFFQFQLPFVREPRLLKECECESIATLSLIIIIIIIIIIIRCVQQLSEHARQLSNLKLSNNRNRDESVSKLTSSIEEKDAIAIYDSTMIHDLED